MERKEDTFTHKEWCVKVQPKRVIQDINNKAKVSPTPRYATETSMASFGPTTPKCYTLTLRVQEESDKPSKLATFDLSHTSLGKWPTEEPLLERSLTAMLCNQ